MNKKLQVFFACASIAMIALFMGVAIDSDRRESYAEQRIGQLQAQLIEQQGKAVSMDVCYSAMQAAYQLGEKDMVQAQLQVQGPGARSRSRISPAPMPMPGPPPSIFALEDK